MTIIYYYGHYVLVGRRGLNKLILMMRRLMKQQVRKKRLSAD